MGIERIPRKKHEAQAEEPKVTEQIESAALKYGDEIFTGRTHADAEAALKKAYPDFEQRGVELHSGFVTSEGRFVDGKEAFEILIKSGADKKNAA